MHGTDLADNNRTAAGVLLFLLPVQFMTALMAGAAIAPGYSISRNAISDLGVIDATAWLFNASRIIAGLLNIIGGYLLYRSYGKGWILAVFVLAGIGAIGAAVFTLDIPGTHGLFAVGLVFLVTHAASDFGIMNLYGPIGHGGSERMIVYPALLWLTAFGGYLMAPLAEKR